MRTLHKAFPEFEIYTEEVEQGLEPPCFSVICGEPFIERVVGKRFFRRFDFCVYFYPAGGNVFSESGSVWDKLIPALELIDVGGDLIRGSDFSTKVVNGVMVMCVSYGTFVFDDEKAPTMGNLKFCVK